MYVQTLLLWYFQPISATVSVSVGNEEYCSEMKLYSQAFLEHFGKTCSENTESFVQVKPGRLGCMWYSNNNTKVRSIIKRQFNF